MVDAKAMRIVSIPKKLVKPHVALLPLTVKLKLKSVIHSISCTVCTLPVDPGPCKGSFPSWFYNYKTGQCEEFIYGGCGGNENRFGTEKDCEAACGSPPVDGNSPISYLRFTLNVL